MTASQMKKGLYLVVGMVFVLILSLLWQAGQLLRGPELLAGDAHAAGDGQPAFVRKKLPPLTPVATPAAEPLPAPTPASEPAQPVGEKPQEAPTPATAPAASASLPELVPAPSPPPAPPPKTEPPKPELKPVSGSRPAYPFSILLSSCRERQNAVAALPEYRKMGLTPYIVETDLGSKGLWWRILAGQYRTLEEAVLARKALRPSDAVVVKTPYANLIGQYGSEREALQAAAQVHTKEVFPYVLRGAGNSYELLAGAFPSQQAADKNQRELESKGIAARTIRR
jgi:hypothetical protein